MKAQDGKFLTFLLGKEEYGIPILKVKEIIGIMDIVPIPRAPEYIKGVINLRGTIIPIMDLRTKLSIKEKEYNSRTCVVVVEFVGREAEREIGIVVDTVCEVISIGDDQIQQPPSYGKSAEAGLLTGIGKVKDKVILLLDVETLFDSEEVIILNETKEGWIQC